MPSLRSTTCQSPGHGVQRITRLDLQVSPALGSTLAGFRPRQIATPGPSRLFGGRHTAAVARQGEPLFGRAFVMRKLVKEVLMWTRAALRRSCVALSDENELVPRPSGCAIAKRQVDIIADADNLRFLSNCNAKSFDVLIESSSSFARREPNNITDFEGTRGHNIIRLVATAAATIGDPKPSPVEYRRGK